MSRRSGAIAAAALVVAVFAGGCGGDSSAPTGISAAWARATPTGATSGVVYLTLVTEADETLVGVAVDSSVAATATLHATTGGAAGGGHHDHGGDDTMVGMQDLARLDARAGVPVVFGPGGNHIMLEGLVRPLQVGQRFTVTLRYADGSSSSGIVSVAERQPEG